MPCSKSLTCKVCAVRLATAVVVVFLHYQRRACVGKGDGGRLRLASLFFFLFLLLLLLLQKQAVEHNVSTHCCSTGSSAVLCHSYYYSTKGVVPYTPHRVSVTFASAQDYQSATRHMSALSTSRTTKSPVNLSV